MKRSREDQRRVTLRYLHDAATGKTSLSIDVESPEDELPHEHKRDMREMAEELLGIPLSELPEEIEVRLRPRREGHAHPHPHPEEERREESGRQGEKVKA